MTKIILQLLSPMLAASMVFTASPTIEWEGDVDFGDYVLNKIQFDRSGFKKIPGTQDYMKQYISPGLPFDEYVKRWIAWRDETERRTHIDKPRTIRTKEDEFVALLTTGTFAYRDRVKKDPKDLAWVDIQIITANKVGVKKGRMMSIILLGFGEYVNNPDLFPVIWHLTRNIVSNIENPYERHLYE
jgi:hypothetical protein